MLLLLSIACVTGEKPGDDTATAGTDPSTDTDTTDSGDTDTTADSGDTHDTEVPDDLNGVPPDEAIAAPEFVAHNLDGAERSRADLLGHPTVMWFYPAAGTYG